MTKSERRRITIQLSDLSDEQLEAEYYRAVYDTLGSEAEIMEERGWDEIDIKERRKYEKWLGERSDLLEKLCYKRGIKVWEEYVK